MGRAEATKRSGAWPRRTALSRRLRYQVVVCRRRAAWGHRLNLTADETAVMLSDIRGNRKGVAAFGTIVGVLISLAPQIPALAAAPSLPSRASGRVAEVRATTVGPAQVFTVHPSSVPPNRSAEQRARLDAAARGMNRHWAPSLPSPASGGGKRVAPTLPSPASGGGDAMSFRVPPRDPPPSTFTIFRQSSPPGIALPSSGSGRW